MPTTVLTGTLIRSGSIPTTALGGGVVSSSVQLASNLPAGTVSSSGQIDYNSITNKLSGVVSSSAQVAPLLPGGIVSSSAQYPGWVTSSVQINTGSFSGSLTGSVFANSGSIRFTTGSIQIGQFTPSFPSAINLDVARTNNRILSVTESVDNKVSVFWSVGTSLSDTTLNVSAEAGSGQPAAAGKLKLSFGQASTWEFFGATTTISNTAFIRSTLPNTYFVPSTNGLSIRNSGNTKDNLIVTDAGDVTITGSLFVKGTAGITGSIAATNGVVSGAAQISALLPGGTISSSAQYPGWVTASSQIDYNSIQNKLSGVVSSSTQVAPLLPAGTLSSSAQYPGWITASSQVLLNSVTGTTFSNQSFYFPIDLRVEGNLTAQQIYTEYVSSSVIYESGSSKFGDTADDVMSVTGSIRVLGGSISGSMVGMFSSSAQVDYNNIQNKLSGVVSSSAQVQPLLPGGTVSSSGQVDITATTNYSTFSSSLATVDAGQTTRIDNLASLTSSYAINATIQGQLAGVVSSSAQVKPLLPGGTVSASGQIDITATTGYSTFSSSLATVDAGQTTRIDNLASQTSSYAINATIQGQLAGVVSSSAQAKPLLPGGTVTSSAQYPGWVTASSQIDYNSITNKLSGVVSSSTQVAPLLPGGTLSSSAQYPGWVTASSQIDYNSIQNKLSGVVSSSAQVKPLLPDGTVSSSAQQVVSTYTNATDNRVLTSTGAGGVNAESTLTYDGAVLSVSTNGAKYFQGGDDAALYDVNLANTLGIHGQQDSTVGAIKLGSSGQTIYSNATGVGIGTITPGTTLHVQGNTSASSAQFTGIVSGSGTSYRLVVPVGTNFYAT